MSSRQIKLRMSLAEARSAGILPSLIPIPLSNAAALSARSSKPRSRTGMADKTGDTSPPQTLLTAYAVARFGNHVVPEFKPLAERKIRLDLAFPSLKLGVEVNGWTSHGKSLKAFRSDHTRTQDLMIGGWLVLPFAAGEVMEDVDRCVDVIEKTLMSLRKRNGETLGAIPNE